MSASVLRALRDKVAAAAAVGLGGAYLVQPRWKPKISKEDLQTQPKQCFVSVGSSTASLASRGMMDDEIVIELALFCDLDGASDGDEASIDAFIDDAEKLKMYMLDQEIELQPQWKVGPTEIDRPAVIDRDIAENQRIATTVMGLKYQVVSRLG